MEYKIKDEQDVLVISFHGKLMADGPEAISFHELVKKHVENGRNKVVADFSEVNFMNSSGISVLIRILTSVRNADGDLHMCNSNSRIMSLLMATKLNTVIPHFETKEEAFKAFDK